MSPSLSSRVLGFTALLAASGEGLSRTAPAATFKALVNRRAFKARDGMALKDGALDFSWTGVTEVEFIASALPDAAVGQFFTDSAASKQRVRVVFQTDFTLVCYCTTS